MSIEARVNKLGLNGLIEDGIHVHSKELIIASQVNVHRFGLAKVLVRINGDSFKELAQKMMEANSSDAIKAFSAALGVIIAAPAPTRTRHPKNTP